MKATVARRRTSARRRVRSEYRAWYALLWASAPVIGRSRSKRGLPPTFGAFAQRTYVNDNILIGYPLSYQRVFARRGPGQRRRSCSRCAGALAGLARQHDPDRGVPIDSAWDTGVAASKRSDVTASVTTGTLGNPLVADDNAGKQLSGRVAFHRSRADRGRLGARGRSDARRGAQRRHDLDQRLVQSASVRTWYTRDYLFAWRRFEAMDAPDHQCRGGARYHGRRRRCAALLPTARTITWGLTIMARRVTEWDAPVTRASRRRHLVTRNLRLKSSLQLNRDGGRVTHLMLGGPAVLVLMTRVLSATAPSPPSC